MHIILYILTNLLRHIFLFCYKESHIYVEMCVWLFGHQKNGLYWLTSFFLSAPKPLLHISFYHSDTMNCISPSTAIVLFDSTTGCQRGLEKWGMEKELSFCLFVSPFWISPVTSLYPDVNDLSSNTCFQITASSSTVRLASKNTIFRHLSPSFMVFLLRASKVLALTRGSVRYFQKNVFLLCRLLPPFSFVFLAFGLGDILGKCCLCNLAVSRLPFHSSSINVQKLLNYINIIYVVSVFLTGH